MESASPAPQRTDLQENLRQVMTAHVGVIRNAAGLSTAMAELAKIEQQADPRTADMALVAGLIAKAALLREESRGAHFRADFPQTSPQWQKRSFTTLSPTLRKEMETAA